MASLQIKFYSNALKTRTNVNVLLPTPQASMDGNVETFADCAAVGPLPVLYLLHGGFGDEGDWIRFSRLEEYARRQQVVVVLPGCENSCYRNTPAGKAYYTYMTEELPQMVQWMFPVSKRREDTFIAGLSMGGRGAYMLGLSRPKQYGYVAALSGGFLPLEEMSRNGICSWAFDPQEPLENTIDDACWLAEQRVKDGDQPELYLACGTEDFLYEKNLELKAHLEKIGFRLTYHEQPGGHDWDFWDDELKRIFRWLPIQSKNISKDL